MTTILMYNIGLGHVLEAEERDVERLTASGFRKVDRHDLVAVFNPNLNEHRTVMKADLQTWLNLGYYAEPTVVYHPEKPPVTVSADHARELYKQGWYDTPAKFPTSSLVGLGGAPLAMPSPRPAAEAVTPGKTPAKMNKAELAQAYFDTTGKTLDAELTKDQMLAEFEKLDPAINTAA